MTGIAIGTAADIDENGGGGGGGYDAKWAGSLLGWLCAGEGRGCVWRLIGEEEEEVEEEKMRLKEQVKELSTEVNTLKTQAQRYVETEKKVTADLQRQVEKHLRTMMLALNESFRASGLVFDPEVQMPGFTHTSHPDPDWQYYRKFSHRWACR